MFQSILLDQPEIFYDALKETVGYLDLKPHLDEQDEDDSSVTVKDGKAISSMYKMWLFSRDYDYIRKPDVPGCYYLIKSTPMADENERYLEDEIRRITEETFTDVNLLDVQVNFDGEHRHVDVYVKIQDKLSGVVSESSVELPIAD